MGKAEHTGGMRRFATLAVKLGTSTKTNDRLETTAESIWAMGDCAGSPQFTHVGLDDYSIVHANLSGGNRTNRNRLIPSCMFTDPELARVGNNEVEARRDGIEYRAAKLPMAGPRSTSAR